MYICMYIYIHIMIREDTETASATNMHGPSPRIAAPRKGEVHTVRSSKLQRKRCFISAAILQTNTPQKDILRVDFPVELPVF